MGLLRFRKLWQPLFFRPARNPDFAEKVTLELEARIFQDAPNPNCPCKVWAGLETNSFVTLKNANDLHTVSEVPLQTVALDPCASLQHGCTWFLCSFHRCMQFSAQKIDRPRTSRQRTSKSRTSRQRTSKSRSRRQRTSRPRARRRRPGQVPEATNQQATNQ